MNNNINKNVINLVPDNYKKDAIKYMRIVNLYDSAIKEVCTRLEILDSEYEVRFERNPIHHIEKRVKTQESIFRKLKKYGFEESLDSAMENLLDIAGIRVICYFVSDVYDIADKLLSHDDIVLVDRKDYIQNPKQTGYRSLHLTALIPIFTIDEKKMVPVEVQIRTVAMDYFASIEHLLKYKNKNSLSEEIEKELLDCADIISETDKIMEDIFQKNLKN